MVAAEAPAVFGSWGLLDCGVYVGGVSVAREL